MPEETLTQAEDKPAEKKQEHHEDQTTLSEYLESLLVTVILALFGTSFIVQAFKIPSASMEGARRAYLGLRSQIRAAGAFAGTGAGAGGVSRRWRERPRPPKGFPDGSLD